jgi:hypothetical protein
MPMTAAFASNEKSKINPLNTLHIIGTRLHLKTCVSSHGKRLNFKSIT